MVKLQYIKNIKEILYFILHDSYHVYFTIDKVINAFLKCSCNTIFF